MVVAALHTEMVVLGHTLWDPAAEEVHHMQLDLSAALLVAIQEVASGTHQEAIQRVQVLEVLAVGNPMVAVVPRVAVVGHVETGHQVHDYMGLGLAQVGLCPFHPQGHQTLGHPSLCLELLVAECSYLLLGDLCQVPLVPRSPSGHCYSHYLSPH